MLWADKKDFSIVRLEGQAVPQMLSRERRICFRDSRPCARLIDGRHRFPVYTYADDTLPFRTGLQRVRMTIRYTQYKRFGADSVIKFEKP